jgi:hypothetical protein
VNPLNIQWSLCYNFIHIYFIKIFNKKVGLNTILTNQFQTYLFLTFIISKFLKFCSWFTINPIEDSIVSKQNSSKIWIYFLMFLWKTTSFLTWPFHGNFLCTLYHAFTPILLPHIHFLPLSFFLSCSHTPLFLFYALPIPPHTHITYFPFFCLTCPTTHSQNFPFFFPQPHLFFIMLYHTHSLFPITGAWWVTTTQS